MTFEELDALYPNGFADAYIDSLVINYKNRSAEVRLNLRRNPPDSPNAQEYQIAVLRLHGFYYFSIDQPDIERLWYPWRAIQINGYSEDPKQFPLFEHLKTKLSLNAFCCRFYVHDWNSFIHIAAKDADFSWIAEETESSS